MDLSQTSLSGLLSAYLRYSKTGIGKINMKNKSLSLLHCFWCFCCFFVLAMQLIMPGPSFAAASPSTTDIVSVSSGQCLNVYGGQTTSGGKIIQWPCDGGANSNWTLTPLANGNYHIAALNSGMCLNVPGSSQQSGVQLIQWPCQSTAVTNDQWVIKQVSLSTFQIISVATGQCVNVYGNSQAQGTQIIQYACQNANGVTNDQFSLYLPSAATGTLPSSWSGVIPMPLTPVGIANLPNNKLMMWSADSPVSFNGDSGYGNSQTYTSIFDVASSTASASTIVNVGANMFCPGTALLPNGNLLVNGGSSSPKTQIYNWQSNTWAASGNMNIPRGYEADTTLPNGSVLTLGGSWSGGGNSKSAPNRTAEIWSSNGNWKVMSGIPENNVIGPDPQDVNSVYRGDNHLWLFATSGGMVFHAGPSAQMNWINTNGNGTISSAGNRGNDPYSINGNAVMYDIGKILKIGGAPAYQQNSGTTYATNSAHLIDISGGSTKPVQIKQLAGMSYRRAFANAVVLPNGSVVVVGGQTIPQPFTDSYAVMVPEIWDPVKQVFQSLRPMETPRTYHSTALLLQDGRVFVGGGGLCGAGCPQNHLNAEILTPPYLLNADGSPAVRPKISSAPSSAKLGSQIQVNTQSPVTNFALMRLSATTHTVNNDQRRIPLAISTQQVVNGNGVAYSLTIPADSGIVLPGYYMLFALNAQGVPSVSTIISIS